MGIIGDLIGTACEITLTVLGLLAPILHPVEAFLNWIILFLGGMGA